MRVHVYMFVCVYEWRVNDQVFLYCLLATLHFWYRVSHWPEAHQFNQTDEPRKSRIFWSLLPWCYVACVAPQCPAFYLGSGDSIWVLMPSRNPSSWSLLTVLISFLSGPGLKESCSPLSSPARGLGPWHGTLTRGKVLSPCSKALLRMNFRHSRRTPLRKTSSLHREELDISLEEISMAKGGLAEPWEKESTVFQSWEELFKQRSLKKAVDIGCTVVLKAKPENKISMFWKGWFKS